MSAQLSTTIPSEPGRYKDVCEMVTCRAGSEFGFPVRNIVANTYLHEVHTEHSRKHHPWLATDLVRLWHAIKPGTL